METLLAVVAGTVVVGTVVGDLWVHWAQDNHAVEAASQEGNVGWRIGSLEEGWSSGVEEDGIQPVHRMEEEDTDSYHILVGEAGTDALEGTLETVASVVDEESSTSQ